MAPSASVPMALLLALLATTLLGGATGQFPGQPSVSLDEFPDDGCAAIKVDSQNPGSKVLFSALHVTKPPVGDMTVTLSANVTGTGWPVTVQPPEVVVSSNAADQDVVVTVTVPAGTSSEQEGTLELKAEATYSAWKGTDRVTVDCALDRVTGLAVTATAGKADRDSGLKGTINVTNTGN